MEQDHNVDKWAKECPKVDCRNKSCKCGLKKVSLPSVLGDDSKDSPIAPKNGAYCNTIVVYEYNGHIYIYSKEGIPTLITSGSGGDYDEIIREIQNELGKTKNNLAKEILDRENADNTLQQEIDGLKNSPDVVDIVSTYADLEDYDTSTLGNNDIIRVLTDENHDGASTYYRWNSDSQTWTYIGGIGDYYTKSQVDDLLDTKQDTLTAGANVTINNNVISATDTTYTHFTGATASADGTQGLVPGPLAGDGNKFLKADGTWSNVNAGGGIKILSTDDFNYDYDGTAGVYNSIALWLLDNNIYYVPLSLRRITLAHPNETVDDERTLIAVSEVMQGIKSIATLGGTPGDEITSWLIDSTTGTVYEENYILRNDMVTDNLTDTSTVSPLSANQGRVLKGLIDALEARVAALEGN